MQKILILICSYPEDGETAKRYKQYAQNDQEVTVRRIDSLFASWDGTVFEVTDPRGEIRLKDFDVVHFAGWSPEPDMAFAVAMYLRKHGVPFTGKTTLDLYPWSKVGEMVRLTMAGIAYPISFYTCNNTQLPALFDWASSTYGLIFPVVVKASTASKGEDNYFVRSHQELAALQLSPDSRYLMQVAIPNDCDYRMLVMGGDTKLAIRRTRTNKDSHLNNTSQGARAELIPTDAWQEGLRELAVSAATALGRDDIAGVDVLIDQVTGKMYVLEVNKTPHMSIGAPNVIEAKLTALFAELHK